MTTVTREQWLAARRNSLGSSDAAAILGLSTDDECYGTPLSVYADKLGLLPDEDEAPHLWYGHKMESITAERFSIETGRTVWDDGDFAIQRHPQFDFLACTVDRWQLMARPHGSHKGILELKNLDRFKAEHWRGGPPLAAQVQIQQQMLVTGCTWGSIAATIGGNSFVYFDVEANKAFQEVLLEKLCEFWDRIQRREPPEATYLDVKMLALLHPDDNGETVQLPSDAKDWAVSLEDVTRRIAGLEKLRDSKKAKLTQAIGDATFGDYGDPDYVFKWSTQERKEHVVKASKSRVLRKVKRK